ncbi:MAG: FAD-dependent oxidoreductase, partial [Pseudomonadota bacterium]
APAPQTARIAAACPEIAEPAATAEVDPCWTVMAAWADDSGGSDLRTAAPFAAIHRSSAKPGRMAAPEAWVGHATATWSVTHLEAERDEALTALLPPLADAVGRAEAPLYATAHRWRFARVRRPVGAPVLRSGPVFAAGDWVAGGEAAGARESGLAAAAAILALRAAG